MGRQLCNALYQAEGRTKAQQQEQAQNQATPTAVDRALLGSPFCALRLNTFTAPVATPFVGFVSVPKIASPGTERHYYFLRHARHARSKLFDGAWRLQSWRSET